MDEGGVIPPLRAEKSVVAGEGSVTVQVQTVAVPPDEKVAGVRTIERADRANRTPR
jgi:hypothetical protein